MQCSLIFIDYIVDYYYLTVWPWSSSHLSGGGISSGIFQGTHAISSTTPFNPTQQVSHFTSVMISAQFWNWKVHILISFLCWQTTIMSSSFLGVFRVLELQSESVLSVLQLASLQQPLPNQQQHQPQCHHSSISLSAPRTPCHAAQSQPRVAYR